MSESSSMSALFQNRFVRTILLSGVFLQIGTWVRNFSVLLFVMQKTHGDSFAISMISVAEYLPILLFSFIGGTFADRWRPKRTMVWSDLLSGLSIGVVLLVLSTGSWHIIFFATLVSSILSQFSQPSGMRLFKQHVPDHLMQAGMSIYQTLFSFFMILGPMIGTFVYQRYGIYLSIAITGVAFLLSAGTLTFLPADRKVDRAQEQTSVVAEMKSGVRYVAKSKVLTLLGGCFLAIGLGMGLIQPLGIFIVTERLGLSAAYFQWFTAVNGIAMIIGGVVAMLVSKRIPPQRLLMFGLLVNAMMWLVVCYSTNLSLTLGAQFIGGLVFPGLQIGLNTLIMKNTDEPFVGRVVGTLTPLLMGGMVLSMSVSGWLKEITSLPTLYMAASVLCIMGVAVILPLNKMPLQKQSPADQDARAGRAHESI